ncbi:glycosyltransferase [Geomicrobium sp. JSM 1781026]|uniref:glycosyltransferase n=1 Tax=Geomicrobium sp. JSM 1781026 TaxID=3344580 RepID=UPI0035BFC334
MRVLLISNMYPSHRAPTFGIFVRNQVEQLQESNIDFTIAAIRDPRTGKKNVFKKYLRWGLGTVTRFSTRYDLVHAHYAFPSGWLARLYFRIRKVPYIVTVHGGDLNKMAKKSSFFKKETKKILQDASHVIAVGPALYEEIVTDYEVDELNVSIINMGVNRHTFFPRMQESSPFNLDHKNILFAGNLIKQKGVEELLQSFELLYKNDSSLRLHFVGAFGTDDYKNRLLSLLSSCAFSDDTVIFHGTKSQDELANFMTHADIFVLPSHIEGFGLVALEAMATGTPVVASRVGGLPSLLSHGAGVLVEPQNPNSLAEGISSLLNNDSEFQEIITAGYKKADQYDSEKIIEQVVNIYYDTAPRGIR